MSSRRPRAHRTALYALLAAWLAGGVAHSGEVPASASPAVARVFDKTIRLADIDPTEAVRNAVRKRVSQSKSGSELESEYQAWVSDERVGRFVSRIWREVTERLLEERGLRPMPAEVAALMSFLATQSARQLDEFLAQQQEIREQLSSDDLTATKRANLEKRLAAVEKLIAFEREERERSAADPDHEAATRLAIEQVAMQTLRSWKVNKALYEKYGGRVIFQQAGYEPVEAYGALIAELDETGAVEVLDPSLPDPFAKLRAYIDLPHRYMAKEEADRYFERPWWLQPQ